MVLQLVLFSLGQQDLRHFSFVLDRQDHIFEKLILEIIHLSFTLHV